MTLDHNSNSGIDRWWAWVILVGSFGYFWLLRPEGLSSYGWSTEFVRLGLVGGNFWAIQLNLLLRLVGIIGHLPSYWSIEAGYLLAAGLGSISLALLYRLFGVVAKGIKLPEDWLGFYVKNLMIVGLLSSKTYWVQSLHLERYMLVVAMGLGLLLLLLCKLDGRLKRWQQVLMGIGLILAASYHWLFWWGALGIGLLGKKIGHLIGGALVLAATVMLMVMIVSNNHPPTQSFFASTSFEDVIRYYQTRFFQDGFEGVLRIDRSNMQAIFAFKKAFFMQPMGGLLIGLFGVGLFRLLWIKPRWGLWAVWMSIGLFGLAWVFFSGLNEPLIAVELYGLVWRVWLTLGAGIGLAFLMDRIRLGLNLLHSTQLVRFLFTLGTAAALCTSLYFGYYYHDKPLAEDRILSADLTVMPQNSLVLCFETTMCSDLLYLQQIAQVRTDLTIIPFYFHEKSYNLDLSAYRPFGYQNYPYIIHEILSVALHDDSTRVFSFGLTNDYYRFLGFDLGFAHYVPHGNYGELLLVTPEEWPNPSYLQLNADRISKSGGLHTSFVSTLLRNRILNSFTYFKSGYYVWGYEEMNAAAPIAHQLSSSEFATFLSDRNSAEQQVKNTLFTRSSEVDSLDLILAEIPRYVEAGYPGRAVDLARGLLLLSPYDVTIRETVASLYERVGLSDLARFERVTMEKLRRDIN